MAQESPGVALAQEIACSSCALREECMPLPLACDAFARLDEIVSTRIKIKRGENLFQHGDAFEALYAVRTGFLKTWVALADGRSQVTGFQMAGEILGLDGIVQSHHRCDAVALEDSEVCVLPFDRITALSREFSGLQHHIHRLMSREIVRERSVMLLLGSLRAEERLAAFLVNLSARLRLRGFSGTRLVLRMSREEIGSYLGLTLETVSRTLSKLDADRTLDVNRRQVSIRDEAALRAMANQQAMFDPPAV